MALAFLCSQVRRSDPFLRISDNMVANFRPFVIDHRLREGSGSEAQAVKAALKDLGLRAAVLSLHWTGLAGPGVDPSSLPNLESAARTLRYRRLGNAMAHDKIVSLLLAHHEDDQYETVLMRLLSGHGLRGLRGMRRANDIPECYDIHGVYQSGFWDDQQTRNPLYLMLPTKRQRKYIRDELRLEIDPEVLARELAEGPPGEGDSFRLSESEGRGNSSKLAPHLAPLDTEDGGVMVYRPLLEFPKDRLIATCEANKVPWFEDHTNQDPTLTTRNTLRYLARRHELPAALQKPAVLRLAAYCARKAAAEEAETDRLISRRVKQKFDPIAGTVVVQLPRLQAWARRESSIYAAAQRRRRLQHYRTIAAILVQKFLGLVTPETHCTPISGLQSVVTKLFPELDDGTEPPVSGPPKALTICGVYFVPVRTDATGPLSWYLARAPYLSLSRTPRPAVMFRAVSFRTRWQRQPAEWAWPHWSGWQLFDGRFWIRVRNRLSLRLVVMPFSEEHAKPFREALLDDRSRHELAALLKKHAPGKVRYTLPALYVAGDLEWALRGHRYWARKTPTEDGYGEKERLLPMDWEERLHWELARFDSDRQLRLIALPTLGVHMPGIEHWVQWEVRYRKLEASMVVSGDRLSDSPWVHPKPYPS